MLPALLACHHDDPRPHHPDGSGDTGGTAPSGWSVALGADQVWSDPAPAFDQHHATTVAVPYPDGEPPAGAPAAWVSWTDRQLWQDPACRLLPVDPAGDPLGADLELAAGAIAAKPDTDLDPRGRPLVAYQAAVGIGLERVDPGDLGEELVSVGTGYAAGNNSVDLAVRSDGSTVLVWFDDLPGTAVYRAAALDADLQPFELLPATLHEVVNSGASTPDVDVDPLDGVELVWVDQRADHLDPLLLDRYDAVGALDWELELDRGDGTHGSRRATVTTDGLGRMAVAWDWRGIEAGSPTEIRLAFVDSDGAWLREPYVPFDGDADGVVVAMVGDDAVWLTWTAIADPVNQLGTVQAALLSFPDGVVLWGPAPLSSTEGAYRPHADAAPRGLGRWTVVTSWEELDPDGIRVVHGVAGTISGG
jgi:hypothetical protein